MADIYITENPPNRKPIEINHPKDRIGTTYIPCGLDKIAGVVITNMQDKTRPLGVVDEASKKYQIILLLF